MNDPRSLSKLSDFAEHLKNTYTKLEKNRFGDHVGFSPVFFTPDYLAMRIEGFCEPEEQAEKRRDRFVLALEQVITKEMFFLGKRLLEEK
jgi:hypothetical protein